MNNRHICSADESASARFDGEAIADTPESTGDDAVFQSWQQLGDSLRQIPVLPADLHSTVSSQIRSESGSAGSRIVRSENTGKRDGNRSALHWLAVSTSLIAVVLVCVTLVREGNFSEPEGIATVAGEDVGFVPDDWEVFVVTVSEEAGLNVDQFMRDSVIGSGLQLQSLSNEQEDSSDYPDVMIASGEMSESLRNVLSVNNTDFDAVLSPDKVGGQSRDELLAQLAHSLQTPTASGRHFGRMYVVLPDDNSVVVRAVSGGRPLEEAVVAGNSDLNLPEQDTRSNSAARDAAEAVRGTRITKYLQRGSGRPVLVVIVRKPSVNTQGRLRLPNHRPTV